MTKKRKRHTPEQIVKKLRTRKGVRSLIGGLGKERFQRTTQVIKLAPDTFIEFRLKTPQLSTPLTIARLVMTEPFDTHPSDALIPDNRTVGHYTTLETLLLILSTGKIKFAPMKEMNDPWEKEARAFFTFNGGNLHQQPWSGNTLREAMLHHIKVFCTTHSLSRPTPSMQSHRNTPYLTQDAEVTQAVNEDLAHNNSDHCCYERLRMWTQYGGQRKGACLLFNRDLLRKQIHSVFKRNVTGFVGYVESHAAWQIRTESCIQRSLQESDDLNLAVEEHLRQEKGTGPFID